MIDDQSLSIFFMFCRLRQEEYDPVYVVVLYVVYYQ